jgi:hypothetical protein
MAAMLQQEDKANDFLEEGIQSASQTTTAITVGLSAWAGIVTLAIVLIGVFVFRRVRRSQQAEQKWSSAASQFSDAETGSMRSMSAASSVVDLSSPAGKGVSNKAFQGSAVEVNLDQFPAVPDLNREDLDFDNVRGIFDDDVETTGEDSYDPSLSNAKAAFGTVVPKGADGSVSKGMRGLFLPDKGNSFM